MIKQLFVRTDQSELPIINFYRGSTCYLLLGRRRVAYFETGTLINDSTPVIIVPGIVVRGEYKTEHGAQVVDVELIENPEYRSKVKAGITKKHYRGAVHNRIDFQFW